MKKKNLKSLKLNKKSISSLNASEVKGGTFNTIIIAYSLAKKCETDKNCPFTNGQMTCDNANASCGDCYTDAPEGEGCR